MCKIDVYLVRKGNAFVENVISPKPLILDRTLSNHQGSDLIEAIIISLICLKRVDQAEKILNENLQIVSFQDDSLWLISNLFFKEDKFKTSIKLLEVITAESHTHEYYALKAKCYINLRILLQGNPGSQNCHLYLEKAIYAAENALNIDNKQSNVHLLLSNLYYDNLQYDKAISLCKTGLELQESFDLRKLLIIIYLSQENFLEVSIPA